MDVSGATEQLQRKLLSWCYYTLNDRFDRGLGVFDEGALRPVPRDGGGFRDAAHYRSVWEPLLLEEAGAQIVRGIEEGVVLEPQPAVVKRFDAVAGAGGAGGAGGTTAMTMPFARASVGVTTARGTFAANDLVLLSKDEPAAKGARRHLHAIGLVEQLEGLDSLRVKLQLSDDAQAGSAEGLARVRATRAELAASAASSDARSIWYLLRLCNASTITREWVALQHVHLLPFLDVVLSGRPSSEAAAGGGGGADGLGGPAAAASTAQGSSCPALPGGMAAALERGCNASQLAAVRSGLAGGIGGGVGAGAEGSEGASSSAVTLIQGPPGTGKTRTILSLLSLVMHAAASGGWQSSGSAAAADAPGTPPPRGVDGDGEEEDEAHKQKEQDDDDQSNPEARRARERAERERLWRLQSPWMFGLPCARDAILPSRDTGSQRAAARLGLAAGAFGLAPTLRSQPRPHVVGSARAPRAHVLVCAPSNSALDEIVLRLLSSGLVDGRGRPYTPSVVRIGVNAHRSVRSVALDSLVDARLAAAAAGGGGGGAGGGEAGGALAGGGGGGGAAAAEGGSATAAPPPPSGVVVSPAVRDAARRAVLAEAAVVCSTLSFAGSPLLQRLANARHFDVVVVDEAAQAVEPSLLVPLVMGMCRRAVLVGDPAQLPATVISAAAAARGYAGSMFARLAAAGHPVHVLDTQYRMHPAISRFPSLRFYGGRLRDGEGAEQRAARPWLLPAGGGALGPLAFHDVRGREEVPKGSASMVNRAEAHACLELYRLLLRAAAKAGGGGGGGKGEGEGEGEGDEDEQQPAPPKQQGQKKASSSKKKRAAVAAPPPAKACGKVAASASAPTEEELQEPADKKKQTRGSDGSDDGDGDGEAGEQAEEQEELLTLQGGRGVAIISPYKAQVRLLRQLFQDRLGPAAQHLDINTIDGFQGREKDVVLFSAVRTRGATPPPRGGRLASAAASADAAAVDGGGSIGFVADERRLNVGLTRARCSLMVVGHGPSLAADANWRALLRHACRERCYWHCPPPPAEEAAAAAAAAKKGGKGEGGTEEQPPQRAGGRRAQYFADAAAGRAGPSEPDELLLARLGGTYEASDEAAEAALDEARARRAKERAEHQAERKRKRRQQQQDAAAAAEEEEEELQEQLEEEEDEQALLAAAGTDDDDEARAALEGVAVDFVCELPAGGEEPVLIARKRAAAADNAAAAPSAAAAAGGKRRRR
jgi:senataxin